MVPYAELEAFFTSLVTAAQARGIPCAITSGMACVHFGVAATTKDCDVLCGPEHSDAFRALITETPLRGIFPNYRGNISPPLDARWMRGGWTSHFTWKTLPEETCLDIFGIAPRGSSPWEQQLRGIYADPNVVAEMKRTNRDRDWPFATALGGQMLDEGDTEGWLHLHDPEVLRLWASVSPPPESLTALRPVLRLSPFKDVGKIKRLLLAERVFWSELDVIRIRIYQSHLRSYVSSLRKVSASRRGISVEESHEIRIDCALRHLPFRPLHDHGLGKMVEEARNNTAMTIGSDVLDWLPAAKHNFMGL